MTATRLRPGPFESELRELADSLFSTSAGADNPLASLLSNTLDIEAARVFFARHWHVEQAYNHLVLSRLMEGCPNVAGRVQIFDVVAGEWGRGDPESAYLELYRRFLLRLGVARDDVPWAYDGRRADVVSHLEQWNRSSWLELLVKELLGARTMGAMVYSAVADALVAAPYELLEPDVVFFRRHEEVDPLDCDVMFELVARYAVTAEEQELARKALRSFVTESRHAPYCCRLGQTSYDFASQPGGIPLRLRDAKPRALSKTTSVSA